MASSESNFLSFDKDPVASHLLKALEAINQLEAVKKKSGLPRFKADEIFTIYVCRVFDDKWVRSICIGSDYDRLMNFRDRVQDRFNNKDLSLLEEVRRRDLSPVKASERPSATNRPKRTIKGRDQQVPPKIAEPLTSKSTSPRSSSSSGPKNLSHGSNSSNPKSKSHESTPARSKIHLKTTPSKTPQATVKHDPSSPKSSNNKKKPTEKDKEPADTKKTKGTKALNRPMTPPAPAASKPSRTSNSVNSEASSPDTNKTDMANALNQSSLADSQSSRQLTPKEWTKDVERRWKEWLPKAKRIFLLTGAWSTITVEDLQERIDDYCKQRAEFEPYRPDGEPFKPIAFVRDHRYYRRLRRKEFRIHCLNDTIATKLMDILNSHLKSDVKFKNISCRHFVKRDKLPFRCATTPADWRPVKSSRSIAESTGAIPSGQK